MVILSGRGSDRGGIDPRGVRTGDARRRTGTQHASPDLRRHDGPPPHPRMSLDVE
jgi:hypothetical protein